MSPFATVWTPKESASLVIHQSQNSVMYSFISYSMVVYKMRLIQDSITLHTGINMTASDHECTPQVYGSGTKEEETQEASLLLIFAMASPVI